MKRTRIVTALLFLLVVLAAPITAAAQIEGIKLRTEIEQDSIAERTFLLKNSLWNAQETLRESPNSSTVIILPIGANMLSLAEVSADSLAYDAGTVYESMDKNAQLYTLSQGEYKPVVLQNQIYTIGVYQEEGGMTAGTKIVGETKNGKTIFTQPVYEKGISLTNLEKVKQTVSDFISDYALFSPNSRMALYFYGKEVSAGTEQTLTAAGTQALLQEISECEKYLSATAQDKQIEALQQAQTRIEQWQAESEQQKRNVIDLVSTVPQDKAAQSAIQKMKVAGANVYALGWFAEMGESEKSFITDISSYPPEQYAHVITANKMTSIWENILENILDSTPVEVRMNLDIRFEVTEQGRKSVGEQGGTVQEENGKQTVVIPVKLPKVKQKPAVQAIQIRAKNTFLGGNTVDVLTEASGIYRYGKQINTLIVSPVNVPIKQGVSSVQAEMVLGEKLPQMIDGKSLLAAAYGGTEAGWMNSGETGGISYIWKYETGGTIGTFEQLKNVAPASDTKLRLTTTYAPETNGQGAVGQPCRKTTWETLYTVKVLSGEITVTLPLTEEEADSVEHATYLLRLQGQNIVQYRTLSNLNRNLDGENIVWEVTFDNLPLGTYTLQNIGGKVPSAPITSKIGKQDNYKNTITIALKNISKLEKTAVAERKIRIVTD